MQSPDNMDSTGNAYGAPLVFDRPVKAVFSGDGGTAYLLNCGQECGGSASSISVLPVSQMLFQPGQHSGTLPTNAALHTSCTTTSGANSCTLAIPGGASNALVATSTMYVVGQQLMPDKLFTGNLTLVRPTRHGCKHVDGGELDLHQRWSARRTEPYDPCGRQHALDRHDKVQ